MDTSRPSSSSPSSPSNSSTSASTPSESCSVCGDVFHSKQYGVPACIGCIVFFRRSIQNNSQFNCWKNGKCVVSFASRCSCRCCRLKKCFEVGMKANSIRQRDKLGPRDPKIIVNCTVEGKHSKKLSKQNTKNSEDHSTFNIGNLLRLQRTQRARHDSYSIPSTGSIDLQEIRSNRAFHATPSDVNAVFKIGICDANEWGNQFESYRDMSTDDKNLVLSEYGIGFNLIEQAFKTAQEADEGCWVFQNGTAIEPGFIRKSSSNLDADFIHELVITLSSPLKTLDMDELECSALKTVLLLAPSYSNGSALRSNNKIINKCLSMLMTHCHRRYPEKAPERYGEIILLLGSIRCAVKAFYNQTKVPGVFHIDSFDECLRRALLN